MTDPAARTRRVERGMIAWIVAVCGSILLTVAIPMTSSAFVAVITGAGNAAAKPRFTCADTFAGERRRQQAYFEFAFDEAGGATTARDSSLANNTGAYEGSNAKDSVSPIACPNDAGGAYALDGTSSRVLTIRQDGPFSTGFSEEVWFKASSPGKLVGYEIERSGESSNYDKHLYIDADNRLRFGLDGNGVQTLVTDGSVVDGAWHLAVATTSVRGGSVLYLDGVAVKSDATMVSGESFDGYWRIGEGKLAGWDRDPGRRYFTGSLRFAAAYPYVLTAQEVASAWSIGKPGPSVVDPTATPEPTATVTATPVGTATATAVPVSEASGDQPATATPATQAPATASPATGTRASAHPESSEILIAPDQQGDISSTQ